MWRQMHERMQKARGDGEVNGEVLTVDVEKTKPVFK